MTRRAEAPPAALAQHRRAGSTRQHADAEVRADHLAHRVEAAYLHANSQRLGFPFCSTRNELEQRGSAVQSNKIVLEAFLEGDSLERREGMPIRAGNDQFIDLERRHF